VPAAAGATTVVPAAAAAAAATTVVPAAAAIMPAAAMPTAASNGDNSEHTLLPEFSGEVCAQVISIGNTLRSLVNAPNKIEKVLAHTNQSRRGITHTAACGFPMAATPLKAKKYTHGNYTVTAYQDVFAIPSVMEYHQRKFASAYATLARECTDLDSAKRSALERGTWQQFSQLALDMATMARAPAPPQPAQAPTGSATLMQQSATTTNQQQQPRQEPQLPAAAARTALATCAPAAAARTALATCAAAAAGTAPATGAPAAAAGTALATAEARQIAAMITFEKLAYSGKPCRHGIGKRWQCHNPAILKKHGMCVKHMQR
jgi:hypothetical protein